MDYLSFIISLGLSIATFLYFFNKQRGFYNSTMKNLDAFNRFFEKNGRYDTIDVAIEPSSDNQKKNVSTKRLKNVATKHAELHDLIEDINEYLESCKGTATFNIIQNKTERRITKLYDRATSKASFPTHYGLMGTFIGVFLGLSAFLLISLFSKEGITDDAIHSLIAGVLVSMSTSFIGLRMSTKANDLISDAKNKNDDDKNEFYEYIQNKLMPSVDISLTEALGNLHQTVSDFEPSFSRVISGFRQTFKECTVAFGDDFRKSVKGMVDAVGTMSSNVNQITENVSLLEELLGRLSGAEWIEYMRQFADASDHFKELTMSLNDFERARRMMLAAVQEAINTQKSYNESLIIPREVASEINTILQRVVKFEQSINDLGETLATTQMIGNKAITEINNQISAIRVKHKVAEKYIETSNNKLEMFFDSQLIELKRLEGKYQNALAELFEAYERITEDHKKEIDERHEIFKDAINEKFELSEVRSELAHLKKLPGIESKMEDVKRGQDKLQRTNDGIRSELNAFNAAKEEEKKGAVGRFLGRGSNSAKDREIEQQKKENEARNRFLDEAQKEREQQKKMQEKLQDKQKEPTHSSSSVEQQPESVATPPSQDPSTQGKEESEEKPKKGFIGRLLEFGRNKK